MILLRYASRPLSFGSAWKRGFNDFEAFNGHDLTYFHITLFELLTLVVVTHRGISEFPRFSIRGKFILGFPVPKVYSVKLQISSPR